MSREAMKLALEYLERRELAWNVQIALREALAEHPAQQITEAQVEAALKAAHMHSTPESRKDMRRAIEATAPQPAQQEPVAQKIWAEGEYGPEIIELCDIEVGAFLYTSPPAQRKPLTDDEIQECWYKTQGDAELFARAIEAKLKEKNT